MYSAVFLQLIPDSDSPPTTTPNAKLPKVNADQANIGFPWAAFWFIVIAALVLTVIFLLLYRYLQKEEQDLLAIQKDPLFHKADPLEPEYDETVGEEEDVLPVVEEDLPAPIFGRRKRKEKRESQISRVRGFVSRTNRHTK